MFRKYRSTLLGITVIVSGMLFYLTMQVFDLWTTNSIAGPGGFCEYFDPDRLVGETMNAWSNFYYVGAGMGLLVYSDLIRNEKVPTRDGYVFKRENLHYMMTYGLLVIWIGLGSFYMHGSNAGNELISGHFFDILAMNMYSSSLIILSMAILFDIKKKPFYLLLVVDYVVIIILMKSEIRFPSLGGGGLFEFFLIVAFINEILLSQGIYSKIFKNRGARQVRRNLLVIILAIITFLLAFWIWQFGKRDHPLCDPYSWWQWHAFWHFLTACGTLIVALYILTEKEIHVEVIKTEKLPEE